MKRVARFGMLVALLFFLACSSNKILSVNDILKVSDLQKLRTQDDYPDAGAVVLYENIQNRFYLD